MLLSKLAYIFFCTRVHLLLLSHEHLFEICFSSPTSSRWHLSNKKNIVANFTEPWNLTSSRREYYIFSGPHARLFSVKKFAAVKARKLCDILYTNMTLMWPLLPVVSLNESSNSTHSNSKLIGECEIDIVIIKDDIGHCKIWLWHHLHVHYMCILIWVTCLFVKEKLWGACTDLPEDFCTAFFRTGDHSKGIQFFFFFKIWIYFFAQFHWKRTCDTNMHDNNFFATKTLACGMKTWWQTLAVRERTEAGRPPTDRVCVSVLLTIQYFKYMYCLGQSIATRY